MHEPSPRTSRLVVACSAAAIAVLGGGGFLLGRNTAPSPPAPIDIRPSPAPVPSPVMVKRPAAPILHRADIIAMANAAADAMASGATIPAGTVATEGARFEVDLPFGCDGPAAEDSREPFQWRYDTPSSTLRVSVAPAVFDVKEWLDTPLSGSPGPSGSGDDGGPPKTIRQETVEGFWIARPWSSRGTCDTRVPSATPSATPSTAPLGIDAVILPGQTLGLAQIFTSEDSQNARRAGKPYESVRRMDGDALKIDRGLFVRLSGRVARFPDGSTVRCRQPAGKAQRPVCLVAVRFDDVAIRNPSNADIIATWASAR